MIAETNILLSIGGLNSFVITGVAIYN